MSKRKHFPKQMDQRQVWSQHARGKFHCRSTQKLRYVLAHTAPCNPWLTKRSLKVWANSTVHPWRNLGWIAFGQWSELWHIYPITSHDRSYVSQRNSWLEATYTPFAKRNKAMLALCFNFEIKLPSVASGISSSKAVALAWAGKFQKKAGNDMNFPSQKSHIDN